MSAKRVSEWTKLVEWTESAQLIIGGTAEDAERVLRRIKHKAYILSMMPRFGDIPELHLWTFLLLMSGKMHPNAAGVVNQLYTFPHWEYEAYIGELDKAVSKLKKVERTFVFGVSPDGPGKFTVGKPVEALHLRAPLLLKESLKEALEYGANGTVLVIYGQHGARKIPFSYDLEDAEIGILARHTTLIVTHRGSGNIVFLYASKDGSRPEEKEVDAATTLYNALGAEDDRERLEAQIGAALLLRGTEDGLIKEDPKTSLFFWEKAAEGGDADACYFCGYMHEHGKGTEKNRYIAETKYKEGVQRGSAKAAYGLGCLFEGSGARKEARELFAKAVEQWSSRAETDCEAQLWLGVCHQFGRGVAKSPAKAFEWYSRAKENGSVLAAKNLAICSEFGIGCQKSPVQAAPSSSNVEEEPEKLVSGSISSSSGY